MTLDLTPDHRCLPRSSAQTPSICRALSNGTVGAVLPTWPSKHSTVATAGWHFVVITTPTKDALGAAVLKFPIDTRSAVAPPGQEAVMKSAAYWLSTCRRPVLVIPCSRRPL